MWCCHDCLWIWKKCTQLLSVHFVLAPNVFLSLPVPCRSLDVALSCHNQYIERLLVAPERIRWIIYADWLFEHWLTLHYIIWQEESIQFSSIFLSSGVSRANSVLLLSCWSCWNGYWMVLCGLGCLTTSLQCTQWSASDSLHLGKLCSKRLQYSAVCAPGSWKLCIVGVGGNSINIHELLRCSDLLMQSYYYTGMVHVCFSFGNVQYTVVFSHYLFLCCRFTSIKWL